MGLLSQVHRWGRLVSALESQRWNSEFRVFAGRAGCWCVYWFSMMIRYCVLLNVQNFSRWLDQLFPLCHTAWGKQIRMYGIPVPKIVTYLATLLDKVASFPIHSDDRSWISPPDRCLCSWALAWIELRFLQFSSAGRVPLWQRVYGLLLLQTYKHSLYLNEGCLSIAHAAWFDVLCGIWIPTLSRVTKYISHFNP